MQEFNARDSWKDKFAQKMSLESCMLWSLARYSGEIYARLPQNKEKLEQGFRSPGGGTGLIHKRQREDDRAGLTPKTLSRYERAQKMPDFDKDIRTTRALANGNPICVGFNIRKGCTFNGCKHMHVCDVKLETTGKRAGRTIPVLSIRRSTPLEVPGPWLFARNRRVSENRMNGEWVVGLECCGA